MDTFQQKTSQITVPYPSILIISMSILPLPEIKIKRQVFSPKKYLRVSHSKKTKTESDHNHDRDIYSDKKLSTRLISNLQKVSQFQAIFTKRNRGLYSGYKQCNLSKSKFIRFRSQQTAQRQHKRQRSFEINLKNIDRLRKRFSFEPNYIDLGRQDFDRSFDQKIVNRDQKQSSIVIDDQRRHDALRKLLKNVQERNRELLPSSIMPELPEIQRKTHIENLESHLTNCNSAFLKYETQNDEGRTSGLRSKKYSLMSRRRNIRNSAERYFHSPRKQMQMSKKAYKLMRRMGYRLGRINLILIIEDHHLFLMISL